MTTCRDSSVLPHKDLVNAIQWIREDIRIHAAWRDYIRNNPVEAATPRPQAETAGDAEHHQLWVDRYTLVLELLDAYASMRITRRACRTESTGESIPGCVVPAGSPPTADDGLHQYVARGVHHHVERESDGPNYQNVITTQDNAHAKGEAIQTVRAWLEMYATMRITTSGTKADAIRALEVVRDGARDLLDLLEVAA